MSNVDTEMLCWTTCSNYIFAITLAYEIVKTCAIKNHYSSAFSVIILANFIFSDLTKEKTELETTLANKCDALEEMSRENEESGDKLTNQQNQQSGKS